MHSLYATHTLRTDRPTIDVTRASPSWKWSDRTLRCPRRRDKKNWYTERSRCSFRASRGRFYYQSHDITETVANQTVSLSLSLWNAAITITRTRVLWRARAHTRSSLRVLCVVYACVCVYARNSVFIAASFIIFFFPLPIPRTKLRNLRILSIFTFVVYIFHSSSSCPASNNEQLVFFFFFFYINYIVRRRLRLYCCCCCCCRSSSVITYYLIAHTHVPWLVRRLPALMVLFFFVFYRCQSFA